MGNDRPEQATLLVVDDAPGILDNVAELLQLVDYRIGRASLPASSSKEFVQLSLKEVGLDPLAQSLLTQRSTGKLFVPSA